MQSKLAQKLNKTPCRQNRHYLGDWIIIILLTISSLLGNCENRSIDPILRNHYSSRFNHLNQGQKAFYSSLGIWTLINCYFFSSADFSTKLYINKTATDQLTILISSKKSNPVANIWIECSMKYFIPIIFWNHICRLVFNHVAPD